MAILTKSSHQLFINSLVYGPMAYGLWTTPRCSPDPMVLWPMVYGEPPAHPAPMVYGEKKRTPPETGDVR